MRTGRSAGLVHPHHPYPRGEQAGAAEKLEESPAQGAGGCGKNTGVGVPRCGGQGAGAGDCCRCHVMGRGPRGSGVSAPRGDGSGCACGGVRAGGTAPPPGEQGFARLLIRLTSLGALCCSERAHLGGRPALSRRPQSEPCRDAVPLPRVAREHRTGAHALEPQAERQRPRFPQCVDPR